MSSAAGAKGGPADHWIRDDTAPFCTQCQVTFFTKRGDKQAAVTPNVYLRSWTAAIPEGLQMQIYIQIVSLLHY